MNTITRTDLIAAVEAGIKEANTILTPAEKIALRTVAITTDKVASGTMAEQGCGCPLVRVGLIVRDGEGYYDQRKDAPRRNLSTFWRPFDRTVIRLTRDTCPDIFSSVYTVTD